MATTPKETRKLQKSGATMERKSTAPSPGPLATQKSPRYKFKSMAAGGGQPAPMTKGAKKQFIADSKKNSKTSTTNSVTVQRKNNRSGKK